jgi:hypothetical protein
MADETPTDWLGNIARDDPTDSLIKNASPKRVMPSPVDPEVWTKKDYELARKVRDELGEDWTKPGLFTEALQKACEKYKRTDGSRFDPKSLREGLRRVDCPKCCKPWAECPHEPR